MAEVGKPTGLGKRGGVYRCRLRYPSDVAISIGRTEFTQSLGTGSYPEALKLFPAARAKFDAEVLEARDTSSAIRRTAPSPIRPEFDARLTEDLAQQLAVNHFRSQMRQLDREEVPARSPDHWQSYVEGVEMDLATLSDPDNPNTCRLTEAAEMELLAEHQLSSDASSPESRLLRAYLRRSLLQIAHLRYARLHKDYEERVTDRMFAESAPTSQRVVSMPPSEPSCRPVRSSDTMLDTTIVDRWAEERKPTQRSIDDHRSAAKWFYERLGRKPIDQVSKADVRSFKDKLVKEGQSPANIRQKLQRLRTLFGWAAENDYIPSNPAADVKIKDPDAARNKRLPFDLQALQAIFSSPLYATGERPVRLRGEAGYWLPLLALFTGARREELGQLRPEDIFERPYGDPDGNQQRAWFIHIKEDIAAGLNLKNASSERHIPVHSELARLGFIEFVRQAKEEKRERLFHLLKPDKKYKRLTGKWGEYWSTYQRKVCRVTEPRMVFHSFRHTFKDFARLAGIAEGKQRQLMGHTGKDVADSYGRGHSDHELVEAMKLYKIPGLKIPGSGASEIDA